MTLFNNLNKNNFGHTSLIINYAGRLDEFAKQTGCNVNDIPHCAVRGGPRRTIYFEPISTHIAIVTCGDLCPGLNDVVRGIVLKSLDYGVPEGNILGIRNGLTGFYNKKNPPIVLTRALVDDLHLEGGSTLLGIGKDPVDVKKVVKFLDLWKIDMLFVIGGPGSHAAALAIQKECSMNKVLTAVVAIPKSIDNGILLVDKTFGFDTAVEEAQKALLAAKVEATSGYRGIGIVKLMGRHSGMIAVHATLASGLVDVCLIPEVPFTIPKLCNYIESIIEKQGHAVICVSEGAGQDLIAQNMMNKIAIAKKETSNPDDKSFNCSETVYENFKLADIGSWLKSTIKDNIKDADIKLIDAGYLIRSIPTNSSDRMLCRMLAHAAVHAAFGGYTGITVGLVNTHFALLPIPYVIHASRFVDPHGELWARVRSSIGQPILGYRGPQGDSRAGLSIYVSAPIIDLVKGEIYVLVRSIYGIFEHMHA